MDFVSSAFLLFLPAALLALRRAGTRIQAEATLTCLSLAFYAYHEPAHTGLFALVVLAGWAGAAYYSAQRRPIGGVSAWKWAILILLPLAYYKYVPWVATSLGFAGSSGSLPLGISFYSFQAVAFCVSVTRGEIALSRAGEYAAVMTGFPQVVAGPIVRMQSVRASMSRHQWWRRARWRKGAFLFLSGAFKKAVLADGFGQIADPVFGNVYAGSSGMLWVGLLAYAVQIYWDFSGYSDMALGLGHWMGWRLPSNFDFPYLSGSLREFWGRWHQTLSAWLRDYVYIPLGGSWHGEGRMLLALLVTMVLGGIWHGAAWGFVFWGVGHGVALVTERLVAGALGDVRQKYGGIPWRVLGRAWTLGVVLLLWVPFRLGAEGAQGIPKTVEFWRRLFSAQSGPVNGEAAFLVSVAWVVVLTVSRPQALVALEARLRRLGPGTAGALAGTISLIVIAAATGHGRQFIYFVF